MKRRTVKVLLASVIMVTLFGGCKMNKVEPTEIKKTEVKNSNTGMYYIEGKEDFDKLTQILENRQGKIIIEVSNGTMTSDNGDGEDISGYYRKYDNTRFSKGDKIQSVFVYNPDNNYIDDILYRVDTLIK
ncbi:MAG: hypothetical protein PHW34_07715 [Hespellia sp.]|nr:hypothetical protein [Hespellia sp.]